MLTFTKLIRDKEGLQILPATTAGLIALIEKHRQESLSNDRYVVGLTGKNA